MKIYTPSYYKDFKCIGGKCKHNCCIGWEIDIDPNTMQKYENTEGVFKKRFLESIDKNGDAPHFILDSEERCPFLNKNNLCDIITEYGEGYLCEICNAHPRFRNFFSNREELGIGLCCEEAARIILTQNRGFSLVRAKSTEKSSRPSKDEKRIISLKRRLLRKISKRDSTDEIMSYLTKHGVKDIRHSDASKYIDLLLSLEIMDKKWERLLSSVDKSKLVFSSGEHEKEFKNLLLYFIYRHITYGEYDKSVDTVVDFCVFSALFAIFLCSYFAKCQDDIIEICRLYSAEIEYSTENTEAIMDALWRGIT